MRIQTIERHENGVRIVVEHDAPRDRYSALPKRDQITLSMPDSAEVTGYGRAGARTIKAAATAYLEAWRKLSAEERFMVLLRECRERVNRADADEVTVARFVAEHGSSNDGGLWSTVQRSQEAHDEWTRMIKCHDLVLGQGARYRQDNDEWVAETLSEAGKPLPEDLRWRLRLREKPLVDPADYPLEEDPS